LISSRIHSNLLKIGGIGISVIFTYIELYKLETGAFLSLMMTILVMTVLTIMTEVELNQNLKISEKQAMLIDRYQVLILKSTSEIKKLQDEIEKLQDK